MSATPVNDVTVLLRCEACRDLVSVLLDGRCPGCYLTLPTRPRSFAFVLITDPPEEDQP
jgi:hypothetical protein